MKFLKSHQDLFTSWDWNGKMYGYEYIQLSVRRRLFGVRN